MKHTAWVLICCLLLVQSTVGQTVADSTNKNKNKKQGSLTFKQTEYNFGELMHKSDALYQFEFRNTGKAPVIISEVKTTCGCTVPEWPKTPIPPKGTGIIKVRYDTNRTGAFTKTVTVHSNGSEPAIELVIRGKVKDPQN